MTAGVSLWLASGSERRRQLLREAGVDFGVFRSDIDDGCLHPGDTPPAAWGMAMARLKARRAADLLDGIGRRGWVIAADTICTVDGEVMGQPRTAEDAVAMLRRFRDRDHQTITAVCLIDVESGMRREFVDRAIVSVGPISDEQIEAYAASGQWQGKAGGYNLHERLEAGWPIRVDGDPTTVIGLPMRRLLPILDEIASGPAIGRRESSDPDPSRLP